MLWPFRRHFHSINFSTYTIVSKITLHILKYRKQSETFLYFACIRLNDTSAKILMTTNDSKINKNLIYIRLVPYIYMTYTSIYNIQCYDMPRGGHLGTEGGGGRIRSLSKFENTPKALISGQKSTLILIKTLTFSSK